jgi:cytoskeletal protein CcmA (bactofilin family)
MRESNYSDMTHSGHANPMQSTTASPVEVPGPSASMAPSGIQNQYSMIGKSIVIKGEIAAADPVYVYGCVEGSINAPQHRVTIAREGR